MSGWLIVALALVALVVGLWAAIELEAWRARRRPPGNAALNELYRRMETPPGDGVERLRDRRPW